MTARAPRVEPLTADRFSDLEALFEGDANTRGCWCMWWRVRASDWQKNDRAELRASFKRRVEAGPPPGLLLYDGERAAGWVQVTPRADVPRFDRTRSARPPKNDAAAGVWLVSCFFLRKDVRGRGLMEALARAACAYAASQGAVAVDAAPIAPRRPLVWGEGYVGIRSTLERAGFVALEQRTELRALMRWTP